MTEGTQMTEPGSLPRRDFLRGIGVLGAGSAAAAALAACVGPAAPPAATGSPTPAGMSAEEIDAHHEAVVKAFPAATQGRGLQELASRLDGDVRVFELSCEEVEWEAMPGRKVPALAYNGQVPGPIIRATEGERVRIHVRNALTRRVFSRARGQMSTPPQVCSLHKPAIARQLPRSSFILRYVASSISPAA